MDTKKPIMLEPPDVNQCQCMKPNGNTFMTLGGVVGMVRCTNKPVAIATEVQPREDGLRGSMSLCLECWAACIKRMGAFHASYEPILPQKEESHD